MKKLTTLLLLLQTLVVSAQITITTENAEICDWNVKTESFDKDCEFYTTSSKYEFNKTETVITHTTPEMKSTYYVDFTEHNPDNKIYTYFVTSDVGNKYVFLIDLNVSLLKTMPLSGEYVIFHYVKYIYK
jgi:hypothetical protein